LPVSGRGRGRGSPAFRGLRVAANRLAFRTLLDKTLHGHRGTVIMPDTAKLDLLAINTIRTLSMDAVQQANSGHPGTPMAMAPVVYLLWQEFLRFDPEDPIWPNRDRFVLSAGHASTLLYSILHLTGVKAVNRKYETLGE